MRLARFLLTSTFALLASAAVAQPSLKMMIPANPGGGWDQTGRNLAAAMQSAKLVSGVQFDNKGGAAGTIGLAQFVNSAKGDPNALMIGGMVMVGGIILNKSPVEPVAGHADRAPDERVGSRSWCRRARRTRRWLTWSTRSRRIRARCPGAAVRRAAPTTSWSG